MAVKYSTNSGLAASATSLPSQLDQYQAGSFGGAWPAALYTVSIGTNDILGVMQSTATDLPNKIGQVQAAVASEMAFVAARANEEAGNNLVADAPGVGALPATTKQASPRIDVLGSRLSREYAYAGDPVGVLDTTAF